MQKVILIFICLISGCLLSAQPNFYFGLSLGKNKYSDDFKDHAVKSLNSSFRAYKNECVNCEKFYPETFDNAASGGIEIHVKFYPVKKVYFLGEFGAFSDRTISLNEVRKYPDSHHPFFAWTSKNYYTSKNVITYSSSVIKIGLGYQIFETGNTIVFSTDLLAAVAYRNTFINTTLEIDERRYTNPYDIEQYYYVKASKTFEEKFSQFVPYLQANVAARYEFIRFFVRPTVSYMPSFSTSKHYIEQDNIKKHINPIQMDASWKFWLNFGIELGIESRDKGK